MCLCGADEEVCGNVSQEHLEGIDDDEDDGDPAVLIMAYSGLFSVGVIPVDKL